MKFEIAGILSAFVLLAACGSAQDVQSSDERFDAAVREMTRAYFHHVPEAATQLGVSEDLVAGTARRMMDRSIQGNRARNRALEAALADLKAIDATH